MTVLPNFLTWLPLCELEKRKLGQYMEEHELQVIQVVGLNAWGVQMFLSGHNC